MKNGRKAFIQILTELAEKDSSVILIVGDVGFSFMESFMERFPKQFLNCGIAEQNMMGVAAGLSFEGMKPYVYTMRNFIAFRPYEQVRNDIAYQNANVKLFGVSGSEAYKFLGMSHNVGKGAMGEDEDVAMLRQLPNLSGHTFTPDTEERVRELMLEEYKRNGPAYFVI